MSLLMDLIYIGAILVFLILGSLLAMGCDKLKGRS
jgi:hypothetical protein